MQQEQVLGRQSHEQAEAANNTEVFTVEDDSDAMPAFTSSSGATAGTLMTQLALFGFSQPAQRELPSRRAAKKQVHPQAIQQSLF